MNLRSVREAAHQTATPRKDLAGKEFLMAHRMGITQRTLRCQLYHQLEQGIVICYSLWRAKETYEEGTKMMTVRLSRSSLRDAYSSLRMQWE